MNNPAPGFEKHPAYELNIEPSSAHVRVMVGDVVVADSKNALAVMESKHRPVWYLPRASVCENMLSATDTSTYCPFKGDASYWNLTVGNKTLTDVMWSYLTPFEECLALKGYVAFYTDRVQIEVDGRPLDSR